MLTKINKNWKIIFFVIIITHINISVAQIQKPNNNVSENNITIMKSGTTEETMDKSHLLLLSKHYVEAIEDNSYFIEESYNQEEGVVQHIFTGNLNFKPTKDWLFSFTQEWPMWGMANQFSYTILYNSINSGSVNGIGDIAINYRYQLFGKEDFLACSPRVSVIIPSGDKSKDLGNGTTGYQFNLPLSKRLSDNLSLHFNAGFTLFPGFSPKNTNNENITKNLTFYNAGAGLIWLYSYNLNFMIEVLTTNDFGVSEKGEISYINQAIINPGFRYAIDIGELQIVPGIAIPITFSQGDINAGVFMYLSFEHPF